MLSRHLSSPPEAATGSGAGGDALCTPHFKRAGKRGKIRPLRMPAMNYSPPPGRHLHAEGCLNMKRGGRDAGALAPPSVPKRGSASAALTSCSGVNTAYIQERSGAGAYPARLRRADADYAVSSGLSFHTSFFLYKYRFTREVIIILSKLLVQSKMRRSIAFVI